MSDDEAPQQSAMNEGYLRKAREYVAANPTRTVSVEVIEKLRVLFGELLPPPPKNSRRR